MLHLRKLVVQWNQRLDPKSVPMIYQPAEVCSYGTSNSYVFSYDFSDNNGAWRAKNQSTYHDATEATPRGS